MSEITCRTANSIAPDQTAPQEQSDRGLDCLVRLLCPNLKACTESINCEAALLEDIALSGISIALSCDT